MAGVAGVRRGPHARSVLHTRAIRVVAKVIASTAAVATLERAHDLAAVSVRQALAEQGGFRIAQSSYGTEL